VADPRLATQALDVARPAQARWSAGRENEGLESQREARWRDIRRGRVAHPTKPPDPPWLVAVLESFSAPRAPPWGGNAPAHRSNRRTLPRY